MTKETELKPCECGGTDIKVMDHFGTYPFWLCECLECYDEVQGFTKQEAIDKWNQRHNDSWGKLPKITDYNSDIKRHSEKESE